MHVGHNYTLKEVLNWTRKDIYHLALIAIIPVILYEVFGWKWVALPWLPIALLGTAVAFVVGFKNNAYDRLWEARIKIGANLEYQQDMGIMTKIISQIPTQRKTIKGRIVENTLWKSVSVIGMDKC
ncbi:MAG: hypothetical protein IPQ04_05870 [Saprospiraceae bacterium]|nr:hypothetical protein [Saprospiraceae bacterium]